MEGLKREVKAAKLPEFDGTKESFPSWWKRFEAYATLHQYDEAIQKDRLDPDLPASDRVVINETSERGKKQVAAKTRNKLAFAALTSALVTEADLDLTETAKPTAWPKGLAHNVVVALFAKYQPMDTITLVELRRALAKVSIKKKERPSRLFEQIAAIKNRYTDTTTQLSREEVIAVVMSAAPSAPAATACIFLRIFRFRLF